MMLSIRRGLAVGSCIAALAASTPAGAIVINGLAGSPSDAAYKNLAANYTSVGQINFYDASSGYQYAASGVVVAADPTQGSWVLTAGHVVSSVTWLDFYLDSGGSWGSFNHNGNNANSTRVAIAADSWQAYPKYDGNLSSGYDIGLIHFSADLMNDGATLANLYSGSGEVGQVGTEVGYGMTGTGATGATTFDGLKRAGTNMIDATAVTPGKGNRILLSDFDSGLASDNSYGSQNPLAYESLIAPGDSGGGLFVPCGDPTSFADDCLAGITSFSWGRLDGNPNSDFGDVGGFTRVSSFLSWIDGIITPSSGGGGGGGGGGGPKTHGKNAAIMAVPEPGTLGLFGLGLIGLGFVARRRRAH